MSIGSEKVPLPSANFLTVRSRLANSYLGGLRGDHGGDVSPCPPFNPCLT